MALPRVKSERKNQYNGRNQYLDVTATQHRLRGKQRAGHSVHA
jgi:hypothetical protein